MPVEQPEPVGPTRVRDLRIDFFRGLALVVMAVDHSDQLAGVKAVSYLTYAPIGVSTAAEVFIFLSGLTLGIAYLPTLQQRGYLLLHARCVYRAWQLYVMQLFCLVATIAAINLIPDMLGVDPLSVPIANSINPTNRMLMRFALLASAPAYFDILPLYIVLLLLTPMLFPLLARQPLVGLGIAGAIYLVAQTLVAVGRPTSLPFYHSIFLNPICWQFLFVIGIALGIRRQQGHPPLKLSGRWLWRAVVALIVIGVWYKFVRLNVLFGWFGSMDYQQGMSIPFDLPWIDRRTLGVVRLGHFLLAAAVTTSLLPQSAAIWHSPLLRPCMMIGRNALTVFVASVIANYAVACLLQAVHGGRLTMLMCDAAMIAVLTAVSYLAHWSRQKPWTK